MKYQITVIKGDGIGPEIVEEAVKVLQKVEKVCGHEFCFEEALAGGCAYDATGDPFPQETLEKCLASDSVLLGAVGGKKWDNLPPHLRPEQALFGMRKGMELFANLRPAVLYDEMKTASPLKSEILQQGMDIMIVRELTGGIYFGKRGTEVSDGLETAYDTETYNEAEIDRIVKVGFETAMKRGKKLASVDKANVLDTSRLWRKRVEMMKEQYPEVEVEHVLVDNAAMQLVRAPGQFDVMVTSNMFGDILSDEAAMITGSIGLLPSASLGTGTRGLYEPIHGSAPDIAGQGIANPIATILAAAMMLRYSFGLEQEAQLMEQAVDKVLKLGYRTKDIARQGEQWVGTVQMGQLIADQID